MIIDCISDLHGYLPKLSGGDLLIVAGDFMGSGQENEPFKFFHWMAHQKYQKKILIAGNHDNLAVEFEDVFKAIGDFTYLRDSGTEFEGLKIWGSPWTAQFDGMNPECMAFTKRADFLLEAPFKKIPKDTDILVTHGPPYGILDKSIRMDNCGSVALDMLTYTNPLKLHIFGHIHEAYGRARENGIDYINCSHVNERYKPVNEPIRVVL